MKRGVKLGIEDEFQSSRWSQTHRVNHSKVAPRIFKTKMHRLKDGENIA